MKGRVIILLVIIGSLISSYANASVSTSALTFVELYHSTSSASQSNALTASGGESGGETNVATLATLSKNQIQIDHFSGIEEMKVTAYRIIMPSRWGVFSLDYGRFNFGDQLRTTMNDKYGNSASYFSNLGTVYSLYYADKIRYFKWGVGIRKISQQLDSYTYDAIGLNVGIQGDVSKKMKYGVAINNLSLKKAKSYFSDKTSKLPQEYRVGVLYKTHFINNQIQITTDLRKKQNQTQIDIMGGVKYKINTFFEFRAGLSTASDLASYSVGMGLKLASLTIDFAYIPINYFSDHYRVGLGLKF